MGSLGKIFERIFRKSTKRMKKNYLIILISILLIALTSCAQEVGENQYALPNLKNKSREEIVEIMNDYELTYIFYFDNTKIYQYEDQYNKFVRYGNNYRAGSVVDKNSFIRIYTTPLQLTFDITAEVTIDFDYEGKSFINDGVGQVTLERTTDGDTARFYDPIANESFPLRFLGIDTPESTRTTDPWGKAASAYAEKMLTSALTIVLESEGSRTETYGRYLGWVWLDGKLYNLMVIQEAYSNSTCSSSSKYYDYLLRADLAISQTGRRVFGEIDPNYNY